MAGTLGGARKMRDAALAAVAGLFLLGALAGGRRRTSTDLVSVAYGLLPPSERVSFAQAAAQCPTTETVRAGVWAAVCPTGDELMWCSPVWKSTSVSGAPDNSSLSHFSAMTRPSWLGRAARNRHRHAIEQS